MSSEAVTTPHRTKPNQARCLENCMVLCWSCSKRLHESHRPLLALISVIAEALSTWSACHLGTCTRLALGQKSARNSVLLVSAEVADCKMRRRRGAEVFAIL